MNVLVPLAGKSQNFPENDYPYPKPLIEIGNSTVIEHVIGNLATLGPNVRFIFVVDGAECRQFHLDSTLNIVTGNACEIVRLEGQTRGAACSALMAIGLIDNDEPLVIANADQILDNTLDTLIARFEGWSAGVITFESVHPRWSYVRLDEHRCVVETSEKRPISRSAIAGFYYFSRGSEFVRSAMRMIKKDASVNGIYYVAPTLNEMVLAGARITAVGVASVDYHTFYTPQKLKEYEAIFCCIGSGNFLSESTAMKIAHLDDMVKGWFVGNFDPVVIKTNEVEISVKEYEKDAFESRHYHKIATEITVIAVGRIKMNGVVYSKGDIIVIKPLQSTDFEAIEHTITTVVKYPGASDDKYLGDPP